MTSDEKQKYCRIYVSASSISNIFIGSVFWGSGWVQTSNFEVCTYWGIVGVNRCMPLAPKYICVLNIRFCMLSVFFPIHNSALQTATYVLYLPVSHRWTVTFILHQQHSYQDFFGNIYYLFPLDVVIRVVYGMVKFWYFLLGYLFGI